MKLLATADFLSRFSITRDVVVTEHHASLVKYVECRGKCLPADLPSSMKSIADDLMHLADRVNIEAYVVAIQLLEPDEIDGALRCLRRNMLLSKLVSREQARELCLRPYPGWESAYVFLHSIQAYLLGDV